MTFNLHLNVLTSPVGPRSLRETSDCLWIPYSLGPLYWGCWLELVQLPSDHYAPSSSGIDVFHRFSRGLCLGLPGFLPLHSLTSLHTATPTLCSTVAETTNSAMPHLGCLGSCIFFGSSCLRQKLEKTSTRK